MRWGKNIPYIWAFLLIMLEVVLGCNRPNLLNLWSSGADAEGWPRRAELGVSRGRLWVTIWSKVAHKDDRILISQIGGESQLGLGHLSLQPMRNAQWDDGGREEVSLYTLTNQYTHMYLQGNTTNQLKVCTLIIYNGIYALYKRLLKHVLQWLAG